jgi:phosphoserine aminotransferase
MVPMNLLPADRTADYLITGMWAEKALKEAKVDREDSCRLHQQGRQLQLHPGLLLLQRQSGLRSFHIEQHDLRNSVPVTEPAGIPSSAFLVCDASSDIFSRPIDIRKYGLIYAGAQKNLGPSGVTLVIVRKDLVEAGNKNLPTMLQYRTHAENESMYNTPPTFGIYLMMLVFRWIKANGGLGRDGNAQQGQGRGSL